MFALQVRSTYYVYQLQLAPSRKRRFRAIEESSAPLMKIYQPNLVIQFCLVLIGAGSCPIFGNGRTAPIYVGSLKIQTLQRRFDST